MLFFGPAPGQPPTGRWDDPTGGFGVCYMADPETPHAAFVERFLREPGRLLLAIDDLGEVAAGEVHAVRDLTVVGFRGAGLTRLGATADIAHGDHRASRPWSAALHAHPAQPDGLQWRSRLDDDAIAVAVFDHAGDALRAGRSVPVLSADLRGTLASWLDRYGVAVV